MANGVFHTVYGIEIDLTLPDLGDPDRPGLLEEITTPIERRERELLECLDHRSGSCRAEEHGRSPWMTIRRRTAGGRTGWVAAHLPVRHTPTPEESAKHEAMKERIARVAERHGLRAEVEARATDGRVRTDVLVTGDHGRRIGWEAQYAPISADTVRRRSRAAAEQGIVPLWVTDTDRSPVIGRAPWARVDGFGWKEIASPLAMMVRAGVRHLQQWKCLPSSERTCPDNGGSCGRFHAGWFLPALCLPAEPPTEVDRLVVASADGEFVPMRIPGRRDPRAVSRMWVPAADRDRWHDMFGPTGDENPPPGPVAGGACTRRGPDASCRYGEETLTFDDHRPRRGNPAGTGLRTFDEVPARLFRVPPQGRGLDVTAAQRGTAALAHGCEPWQIGPCARCGSPIHRYGGRGVHACAACRARVARR
ncbi:hypothetical protein ACIQOW_30940 [Kitasatospora sp. NPDC091335]|uniref:competence protein CoiA family protein n=1 Tax=Kitasatospora sp. NPDC091335 TaxID=3364085 RepID=UPI0037F562C9